VIEDNPTSLELMDYPMQAWHHETIVAQDGEAGLAMARLHRPDLVVCDVQMTRRGGYEVARELKADPALRHIPRLAATAYAMVGDREKALAAGLVGHFAPPIGPAMFTAALVPLLPSGQAPTPALASASAAPAVATSIAPALRAPRSPCTLPAVDDGPMNVECKRSLLEPAGYRVRDADSVEGAMAVLQGQPPADLVL